MKTPALGHLHLPMYNSPPFSPPLFPLLLPPVKISEKNKTHSHGKKQKDTVSPNMNTSVSSLEETESLSLKKSVLRVKAGNDEGSCVDR